MNLIQSNITKSSDLLFKINEFREREGLSAVRNSDFNARIHDEIDEDLTYETFVSYGQKVKVYHLTGDQCLLVGMRESKTVRKRVLMWIKSNEESSQPAIPQTLSEALQLAADQAKQLEEAKPKLEYHDKVLATENGITTTEVASEVDMTAQKLNSFLKGMEVQKKISGRWVLCAKYLGQGLTVETTHVDDGGKSRHSMKWTESGRKFIHDLIEGE